jgi:hypothetical protein
MLVDNTKMDLGQRYWGGVVRIFLVQDREMWLGLVYTVMEIRVP